MPVCSPDIPRSSASFTLITPRYWSSLFHNLNSLGRIQRNFSAVVAIHTVPILFLVDRGGVDSKFAQGFYTWHGIELQTLWSRVQRLNHSATCSTYTTSHLNMYGATTNLKFWTLKQLIHNVMYLVTQFTKLCAEVHWKEIFTFQIKHGNQTWYEAAVLPPPWATIILSKLFVLFLILT